MNRDIIVRVIRDGEEEEVCEVVRSSFDPYVGREYTQEGVIEFYKYANPLAMAQRLTGDDFVLVAENRNRIVGMIEIRENEHLSMLFVEPSHFRQGIGRSLFEHALSRIREANPGLERVTVHSSRYAVPVYESFGFVASGSERTVNGIMFVPMFLRMAR